MKIWIFSDLHLQTPETASLHMPFDIPEADVCVVAGDICDGVAPALNWIGKAIRPHMPVMAVLGNHEYFGHDIPEARRCARAMADDLGIALLDNSLIEIDGVRFVGGTLWTDFRLFEDTQDVPLFTQRQCMAEAKDRLGDFYEIWATEASDQRMARVFNPRDAVKLHEETVSYLDRILFEDFSGPTIVLTHHAPSPRSLDHRHASECTSGAFASDLDQFIRAFQPDLWVHGHVHNSFDYFIERTRVLCNPRGFSVWPNADFDPNLVVTL